MPNWSTSIFAFFLITIGFTAQAEQSITPDAAGDDLLSFSLQQLIDTRVTVASLSEEKLSQTPVPVTVITEQMIQQSGALNLKSLLLTYVPGFTDIEDQNEINISARGIFTSAQQKILLLVNGHRLNSRSYAMATPDASISLDKISQIEVLRGPASSIYGNVSLTATINIILKKADNTINKASLLIGNYGQQGATLTFSQQLKDTDILFWANTYKSDGEMVNILPENTYNRIPRENNQAILNGIRDKSPYDIGANIDTKIGSIFINSRRSHYIEPFTAAGLSGESYDYDKFEKIDGVGPGLGYVANHLSFSANPVKFGDWQNKSNFYFDKHTIESSALIDPIAPVFGGPKWKEQSIGLQSTFEKLKSQSHLLIGGQIEYYKVYGDSFPLGVNSFAINTYNDNLLSHGSESSYSLFTQYKRKINAKWQANIGGRYDYKNRKLTANQSQLSPRLGIVYEEGNTSIKFSYSEAFVDATYWNRFSNLASFKGAQNLKPETLKSWQISPTFNFPKYNVQLTSNLFFDQSEDVIFRDNSAMDNNYSNAGQLEAYGIEQEINYITSRFNIRFNATYRRAKSSEKIAIKNGYVNNVPKFTTNLVFDTTIVKGINLHLALRYVGRQYSPIVIQQDGVKIPDPFPETGVSYNNPNYFESASLLVNANIQAKIADNVTVNFRVNNLLDESRQQGGSTLHPYPKPSRWFSAQVSWSF